MSTVFVIDANKAPLDPCSPARARQSFTIKIAGKPVEVHQKYCTRLFAADGYSYAV